MKILATGGADSNEKVSITTLTNYCALPEPIFHTIYSPSQSGGADQASLSTAQGHPQEGH